MPMLSGRGVEVADRVCFYILGLGHCRSIASMLAKVVACIIAGAGCTSSSQL